MSPAHGLTQARLGALHQRVNDWYAREGRADLPWRDPSCSPWGVFVSEVMAQQTPLSRVEPMWRTWLQRWPTPAALAAASPGEVIAAWGRLGYPRRALRLREAAIAMLERHDGQVPSTYAELVALPGVGSYTAAAVACFAFGVPEAVIDTNVRRVQARAVAGTMHAAPSLTRAETELARALMPAQRHQANVWNVAVMELGALVCTARAPRCEQCPIADLCAWNLAGRPAHEGPPRRGQAWAGTDRQVRGEVVQRLRDAAHRASAGSARSASVALADLLDAATTPEQALRCIDSLVADGLVEPLARNRFRLPR